ncbi:uncharacterized protein LOC128179008 [Crassostrea angulata]|uniref:uncharacterized protein LOC128179008 n=1 Tax=Magallana angulata TaxID=2784310 RepID=UPI0022B166A7|nr:uncharacterized protein LOC128179008 [Crassostrea angulata]
MGAKVLQKTFIVIGFFFWLPEFSAGENCGNSRFCPNLHHCCRDLTTCCPNGYVCAGALCISIVAIAIPCVVIVLNIIIAIVVILVKRIILHRAVVTTPIQHPASIIPPPDQNKGQSVC